jgi:hypothetical protein
MKRSKKNCLRKLGLRWTNKESNANGNPLILQVFVVRIVIIIIRSHISK